MTYSCKRYLVFLLAPLALLVIPPPSFSQDQEAGDRSRIVGYLFNAETNEPISDATLTLEPVGRTALTNEDGRFQIRNLHPGEYTLRMEHVAYGEQSIDVDVPERRTVNLDIELPPEAIEVEPVEVRVEATIRDPHLARVGYYERKEWAEKVGAGEFLEGAEVQRRGARTSHVLSTIPGLRVMTGPPHGFVHFNQYRRSMHGGPCFPAIYLDGHKIIGSTATGPGRGGVSRNPLTFDSYWQKYKNRVGPRRGLNELVSPAALAAVEVYKGAASTAGEFQGSDSRCGVIALWTQFGPDPDSANR